MTPSLAWMCAIALLAQPSARTADTVGNLLPLSPYELLATAVVTASRRAEGREQMRDRRHKSLADLREDLPGVDFQRATRSSRYNNFVFQGHVSNNKILILLDGVCIDHPAGGKIPVAEIRIDECRHRPVAHGARLTAQCPAV